MQKFLYLCDKHFTKKHLLNKSIIIFLCVVMMLLNTGCSPTGSQSSPPPRDKTPKNLPPLKIGILPTQNPKDQQRMIQRFDNYLEKSLGRTIDVKLAKNYNEAVDWLVQEKVDIAYLGLLNYFNLFHITVRFIVAT